MSRVTTAPAPMMLPLWMVTPCDTKHFAPIQTSEPIFVVQCDKVDLATCSSFLYSLLFLNRLRPPPNVKGCVLSEEVGCSPGPIMTSWAIEQ